MVQSYKMNDEHKINFIVSDRLCFPSIPVALSTNLYVLHGIISRINKLIQDMSVFFFALVLCKKSFPFIYVKFNDRMTQFRKTLS